MNTAYPDHEDLITTIIHELRVPCHEGSAVAGLPDQDVVYRGWVSPVDQVVVIEQPGVVSAPEPLPHLVRHSPAGLHWGYDGNGPRDLALSLLADTLGGTATCTANRYGHEHAACWGGLRPLPYLRLTSDVIAGLPLVVPWTLRRWDIIVWLLDLGDRPVAHPGRLVTGRAR